VLDQATFSFKVAVLAAQSPLHLSSFAPKLSALSLEKYLLFTYPYLDILLTVFQQESKAHISAKTYQLPEPLSQREREVLQLLARGASNLEIAQELVIVIDTVKCHISHIFSKLGTRNRVQAVRQAQALGILKEEL
jgi:DNA-binding NarL/FixJ family response regulator